MSDLDGELGRLVEQAREAPGMEPPMDLWPDIASAIASIAPGSETEVIELPTARTRVSGGPGRARLAAAAVLLIIVSGSGGWWAASSRSARATSPPEDRSDVLGFASDDSGASPSLAAQLRVLEEAVRDAHARLDPSTVEVLERNLVTIESAIADSRAALTSDPGNAFLSEHLERMYRRKLLYLQDVVQVAEWAG